MAGLATSFDLFLLDQPGGSQILALGRRGADTAIEQLPLGNSVMAFSRFGERLAQAVTGNAQRPSARDLSEFGSALFGFLFRDSLLTLYNRLPSGAVSLQIFSDRPDIRAIPWEYLLPPDCRPVPHRHRSVVRIQRTCGVDTPRPKRFGNKVRVLFVSADPVDQPGVTWEDVEATIHRAFVAQLPDQVTMKVVPGATRTSLINAVNNEQFDIFHFFGHGDLRNGVGHLVLQDLETSNSNYLSATDLAVALAGKGVQLAILSACLSVDCSIRGECL